MSYKLKYQAILAMILLFVVSNILLAEEKNIKAEKISKSIKIDGFLNEDEWARVEAISDFVQREPIIGSEPSLKTEVKILYDETNLYIGVICYDDKPNDIIARELKRDGRISRDDNFKILLDTFNDNKSAYWFTANPIGAVGDALYSGDSYRGLNTDWDGVWDVKTQILDYGWSLEFVFPFSLFKFYDLENQIWGINFTRGIQRLSESVTWSSEGENRGFYFISVAGNLIGLENIKRGNPIYISPYLTAGAESSSDGSDFISEPGLDIKYGLSETLSLDVTINTDFAQVESDRDKINLSRFPLFFPEKRDFFLEGAKTLSFSLGGRNQLFHSRRIGISDGQEIPILAGAKLVGRLDDLEIGFLSMQTDSRGDEPTTNFSTIRLKKDIFEQSFFGIIFTNKMSKNGFNRTVGGDFNYRITDFLDDKNLTIGLAVAKSFENNNKDDSWAGRFFIDYPNQLIDQRLQYSFINNDFNPEMGYVRRKGIQQLSYNLRFQPRVYWGSIKQLRFAPIRSDFTYDAKNELVGARLSFEPIGFNTIDGSRFGAGLTRVFDFVDESYKILDSTYVPVGNHWFTYYYMYLGTSNKNSVSGSIRANSGEYYHGYKNSITSSVSVIINKHLAVQADYSVNDIRFNSNNFATHEIGSRLKYNFSTNLSSSMFAQWNNSSKDIFLNYRVNWKPKIGSDIYLAINQRLETKNKINSKNLTILAKAVWLFSI